VTKRYEVQAAPTNKTEKTIMNNVITLVGRVTQNPVQKSIPAKDTVVAEFSIAVKDYSRKGQENDAIFFDVKAFNGQVDRIMAWVEKGREIVVNGRVAVETYNRLDGTKMIKYVVILNGFHLCGSKIDKEESPETSDSSANPEGTESAAAGKPEKKGKKAAA
jgi:single stranded DNA-binding protein